jgi:uncharacterized protein
VFNDVVIIFLGILIEALPFIVLGVMASSFLHVFVKTESLINLVPKSRILGTLFGPVLGFFFPVCECGNIPFARQLIKKGMPIHTVIAFLLSAPVFNPIVILATLAAFQNDLKILFLRIAGTLVIALIVSFAFYGLKKPEEYLQQKLIESSGHKHTHGKTKKEKWIAFLNNCRTEFIEMMVILSFGAAIAASSQLLFTREAILDIGTGPISSVVAMQILAAVTSICSNVDAFFALSFINNFSTGAILAFLIFGPMIDIKALIMMSRIFRLKVLVYMTALIALLSFLLTVFYNLNIGG